MLEQEGHGLGECVALGHKQQSIQLTILVAGEFHVCNLRCIQPRQTARNIRGVRDNFRQTTFAARQDTVAVVKAVMDPHVTQGGEAVEPRVGNGLHGLRKSVLLHPLDQALALIMHLGWPGLPSDQSNVTLLFARRDVQRTAHLGQSE